MEINVAVIILFILFGISLIIGIAEAFLFIVNLIRRKLHRHSWSVISKDGLNEVKQCSKCKKIKFTHN